MKSMTISGRSFVGILFVCIAMVIAVAQVRAGNPAANNNLTCDYEVFEGPGTPIQTAITAAASGQTICVHGGTYHEIIKVPTGKPNLTLIAVPGEMPIIDGRKILPGGLPEHRFLALVELNAVGTTLDGFEVRFSSARGVDVTANNIVVRNSSVHDNWSTGINVRGSGQVSDVLVENNQVYRNMRRAQNAPVIYRAIRSGSGPTDWTFDPDSNWDNPFWTGVGADLPDQYLNDISMTFDTDGLTSRVYAASPRSGRVGYIGAEHSSTGQQFSYSGADILFHTPSSGKWTLYFDGDTPNDDIPSSGLIDAFQIETTQPISPPLPCVMCTPLIMSFTQTVTISIDEAGVVTDQVIGPSDLVRFSPTSIDPQYGRITGGSFSVYLRAADIIGLPVGANIDALDRAPDGRLLMSFSLNQILNNPDGSALIVQKEDLVAYDENGGERVWDLFFNGNDIPFNPFNAENLTAAWLDSAGNIYISGNPIGGSALTLISTLNSTARGNTVYNNFGEGLVSDRFSVGATLDGNTVYDNLHANLYLNSTTNPLVRGNLVYCTDDPRFWAKGSTQTYRPSAGIQIRDESFESTVQPPPSSGQIIINNIVIGCGSNFGVATQPTIVGGGLNNALVANNVFADARGQTVQNVNNGVNNIEVSSGASYANSRFINNLILQNNPSGMILRVQGANPDFSTFTVANNLYSVAPPSSWFSGEPGRVVGNPQLAVASPPVPQMGQVPDAYAYQLTFNSPALDAGQNLSEVSIDFSGQSRAGAGPTDVGAFELPHNGRIVVVQRSFPAGSPQSFQFTADFAPNSFNLLDGQQQESNVLQAGTYNVSSAPVENWTTASECSDGSPAGAVSVAANETVTCTFTSVRETRLTVNNAIEPAGDPQVFDFTLTPGEAFQLGATERMFVLEPGLYSLQATLPTGWERAVSCDNGDNPNNITLDPGEWVTCSFTHRKMGRIIVNKLTDPPATPGTFQFTATYGNFNLSHNQSHDSGFLTPGMTYSVTEAPLDGWAISTAVCVGDDDGTSPAAILLDPGETVTCTFTSTRETRLTVANSILPAGDPQQIGFSLTPGGTFQMGNESRTFVVEPGAHSVAATVPAGWQQTGATCNNNQAPSALNLAPGEWVTCTFAHRKMGRIIVNKLTDPPATPGTFQFTATYGNFSLSHNQSHDSGFLTPGMTYSVTEAPLDGWAISTAVCVGDDDGTSPAAILLDPGETVTCTFTSSRTASGPQATIYVTTPKANSVRGLAYSPGDILAYNKATDQWALYFDASDVGITKALNDFVLLPNGSILMAFKARVKVLDPGGNTLTIEPHDIVRFIPTQTGSNTSGRFELYFDGSDVALTTSGEKIDALAIRPDGVLLISTTGTAAVKKNGATLKAADEDLLAFTPSSLGQTTAGEWDLLAKGFDGSKLTGMGAENVTGAWYDAETGGYYLTLANNFKVNGVSGTNRTVLSVSAAGVVSVYWNAATANFTGAVDGLHIQITR